MNLDIFQIGEIQVWDFQGQVDYVGDVVVLDFVCFDSSCVVQEQVVSYLSDLRKYGKVYYIYIVMFGI